MHQKPQKNSRKTTAIILLTAPTAAIVLSFVLGIVSSMNAANSTASGDLFGNQPTEGTFLNILVFLFATAGFITWLPGVIIGIVLLTTKKK